MSSKIGIGRLLGGGEFSNAPPAHRTGVEGSARQALGGAIGLGDDVDREGLTERVVLLLVGRLTAVAMVDVDADVVVVDSAVGDAAEA